MTPSALIAEKVRETTERKTDYATARALGISQSNLKRVLAGDRALGTESCVRAAELLRKDVTHILAEVGYSSAKTPEKKAFWEKRLPRILPAVALWGLAAGLMQFTSAKAATCISSNYSRDDVYIMRTTADLRATYRS